MIPGALLGVPVTVWALRCAVVLGPLVAVTAAAPEGYAPSLLAVALVLVSALLWAFLPDQVLGSVSLLVVLVWWALVVGEALPVASVVAAAGLLLSHTAATLLAYGPSRTRIAPRLLVTWTLRAAVAWLVALAVWGAAEAYRGQATPASFWLLGLTAALVGAVVAGLRVPVRGSSGS